MKKLYWKAFAIHFFTMFLFLSTILFPLMALVDKIAGDSVHVWERMLPFVVAALIFAWVWVGSIPSTKFKDDYDRQWQLDAVIKSGWEIFFRSSPIGWIVWLIATLGVRNDQRDNM